MALVRRGVVHTNQVTDFAPYRISRRDRLRGPVQSLVRALKSTGRLPPEGGAHSISSAFRNEINKTIKGCVVMQDMEALGIETGDALARSRRFDGYSRSSVEPVVDLGSGRVIRVERAVALQASAQEPGACRDDGWLRRAARTLPVVARLARSEGQRFGP